MKVSTDIFEELCDVEQEAPEEHRALLALVCAQSAHRHRCGRAHAEAQQQAQRHGAGEICTKRKKHENLWDPRGARGIWTPTPKGSLTYRTLRSSSLRAEDCLCGRTGDWVALMLPCHGFYTRGPLAGISSAGLQWSQQKEN